MEQIKRIDEERGNHEEIKRAPDGGYGWFVVVGVVLLNLFNNSIVSVYGLLFADHLERMNQKIVGVALLANLNSLTLNFSGFLTGKSINTYGPRKVAFSGCLLTSLGLLLCALSTQLWQMVLGYSIMVGLGLGLIGPSTFIVINSYFYERRGSAVGIALAGTGMGQMVLPHLVRILLENLGYRSTVLMLSGLTLNGVIGACLFRPVQKEVISRQNIRQINLLLSVEGKSSNDYQIDKIGNECEESKGKSNNSCKKMLKTICQALNAELLKDPIFCNIIIGIGCVYTASTNFTMLLPYFLQLSVGLSKNETAVFLSVLAGVDIFCRLTLPIITSKLKISFRFTFLLGCIGLLCSRTILAETNNYWSIMCVTGLYGAAKSATVLNNNLAISEYCEAEKLPGALGWNMISKGIIVISLGQLLGWLRDYSESYTLCLHAQNFIVLLVIMLWTFEFICINIKYRERKKVQKTEA